MSDNLFPSPKEIKEALLSLLHFAGGELRASDTYEPLANYFELSNTARKITRAEHYGGSHPELAWHNLVQYGRRALKSEDMLDLSAPRGTWRLNRSGKFIASDVCDDYYGLHPSQQLTRSQDQLNHPIPKASDLEEPKGPNRALSVTYRILRDTELARAVKAINDFRCQVCRSDGLDIGNKQLYAEAHHIKPLGKGGPDSKNNILCVCPSCHVKLDYFAIELDSQDLTKNSIHEIGPQFILYHNEQVRLRKTMAA